MKSAAFAAKSSTNSRCTKCSPAESNTNAAPAEQGVNARSPVNIKTGGPRQKAKPLYHGSKKTNNSTYNESSYNNIDKNMDKNNNFLKNNNSYYNLDNTYKKKLPISPIYPKNNKFIPGTEVANNKIVKEY